MTPEQKELLLKDLCARLPYGVKLQFSYIITSPAILKGIDNDLIICDIAICELEDVKPYLLPLSSMTEEQKKECNFVDDLDSDILDVALCTNHYHRTGIPAVTYNLVDWCIKNHFDYRGLIPLGLANDATGLNIY